MKQGNLSKIFVHEMGLEVPFPLCYPGNQVGTCCQSYLWAHFISILDCITARKTSAQSEIAAYVSLKL